MKQMPTEQLLNDGNGDIKCSQPQILRSTSDIQTLFQELCDQQTDDPCVVTEATKPLVQISNIEKRPLLSRKTVPAPLFEANKPIINTIDQVKESKNKRKLQLTFPLSDFEKEEPKENDQSIPIDSTVFIHHGIIIPIHVDQLHGVKIGHGNFGFVSSVVVKSSLDIRIAVKHSRLSMLSEVKILETVNFGSCPYIVDYYCSMRKFGTDELYICMELMDTSITKFYQTMHTLNKTTSNQFDQLVRRISHDIASALFYLEIKEILHRDIKPDNLLINKNARVKLADFGLSRTFSEMKVEAEGILAAVNYMPPNLNNSIQDDMWALGISLFEVINGENPFGAQSSFENLLKIRKWEPDQVVLSKLSEDLQELILHLLKKEANERPRSYIDILNKPSMCKLTQMPTNDECSFVRDVVKQISRNDLNMTRLSCFCSRVQCTCVIT